MEVSINCNDCFGKLDGVISSVTLRDKDNCFAVIEGYTLTVYKMLLPNDTQALHFCDLDTEDPDCQINFTSEKITPHNFFWNRYEVSKEDATKLVTWLRSRWRCIQGDRNFVEAFNNDGSISADLFPQVEA